MKRMFRKILDSCPASRRKTLSGIDNVAAEVCDYFDKNIEI